MHAGMRRHRALAKATTHICGGREFLTGIRRGYEKKPYPILRIPHRNGTSDCARGHRPTRRMRIGVVPVVLPPWLIHRHGDAWPRDGCPLALLLRTALP